MRISLIAVGTRMPDWIEAGVSEYRKRLPPEINFEIREIALAKRGKNVDVARAIQQEGSAMLAAIAARDIVIALDVLGKRPRRFGERMSGARRAALVAVGADAAASVGTRAARRADLSRVDDQ
jgi:rRNA large subunit m3Psi methyltransferase RlmH